MDIKLEIKRTCHWARDGAFTVWVNDEEDTRCHTLAEAYLYAAKRFHELGMLELQERINRL